MLVRIDTYHDGEFWCARGIEQDIFTQGRTYEELLVNIKEAVSLHMEEAMEQGKTIEILIMSEMEINNIAEVAPG